MTNRTGHWLGAASIYLLVLGAASLISLYSFPVPDEARALAQAQFARVEAPMPAGVASSDWGPAVALPDDWRLGEPPPRHGWYRARLRLDGPIAQPWAVVIPTVRLNAEVYVNGRRIGSGGRFEDPVARNLRRPLMFNVPDDTLRQGDNELLIRVKSGPDRNGFLSRVYVGPEAPLRHAYLIHYWVRITGVQLITLFLALIGAAVGVLAWLRRSDAEYRYFSVAVMIWAAHSLSYFTVDIPVSDRLWDWFMFATIGYFAVIGGIIYVHRFVGVAHLAVERAVFGVVVALSLVMAFLPEATFYAFAYYFWHPMSQAIAFYGLVRMVLAAWQARALELHVVAASGLVVCVYATHDLALVFALADWEDGYYIQYAMFLVLGLFCAVLLQRFVRSLNESEALNRDLEQRVEASRKELERQYERLRVLENEQVLADERDRIMRDMHDGMGSHLVSTLATIDQGQASLPQIEQSLRAALQDLRLMIDSLDVAGDDIPALLGMFRSRVEPSLIARGVKLRWEVGDVEDIPSFGARKALHVLRILQEAVTNVIRHSAATELRISTHDLRESGTGTLLIEVRDNGRGIVSDAVNGRGIANMRQRAAAIGALLTIESPGEGTRIALRYERRSKPRQ